MAESHRIHSLDYLRTFVVVLVVVLHGSVGYMVGAPEWWYVIDPNSHGAFTALVLLLDVGIMPIMFFVAGYFALPSLARRGPGAFLRAKLVRIGIPWVVGTQLLAPPLTYLTYLSRGVPMGLWQFWRTDFWGDMYQQSIYWYLGVLLVLFLALAIAYGLTGRWRSIRRAVSRPSWMLFAAFAAAMTAAFWVVGLFYPLDAWIHLDHILTLQPLRTPLFVGYFALGLLAYSRRWFTPSGYQPDRVTWVLACVASATGYLAFRMTPLGPGASLLGWSVVNALWFNGYCLSSLMAGVAVFQGWPAQLSSTWQSLTASSYGIYFIHPLFQWPLALLLMGVALPAFVKATAVIAVSGVLAWALSARVLTRAPVLRRIF